MTMTTRRARRRALAGASLALLLAPRWPAMADRLWHYTYDDNGNLISQTDPKGQTIRMCYDALNRITLKDLPPNFTGCDRAGAGCEDETYFYDGEQAPPSLCGCTFSISPTSAAAPSGGATGSVGVSAPGGCPWTASSANPAWLTITSGSSGSGSGTVAYSAAANPGPARSGALTIAGQAFTLSQAGACSYTITPTSASVGSGAGTGSVSVTAGSGCAWSASSNASWLSIASGGSGSGSVGYSVAANTGPARTGTLTVAGQTFTVNQANGCNTSCWPDLDGDGFGAGTPTLGCGSCPSGYVTNGDDCFDGNANARPGQTQCFTTPREDGSYDYDCSGSATVCNPTTYSTSCGGTCSSGCTRFGATVTSSQCGQSVPTGCALSGCPHGGCTVGSYTSVSCR
jgi:YD repeat-containing protein